MPDTKSPEDPNQMFGTPGPSRPTAPPPETPDQPAEAPGPVSYVPTSFLSTTSYRDDPDRWERHWELVYQQNLAQQGEDSQNRQVLDHYLRENPQADRERFYRSSWCAGTSGPKSGLLRRAIQRGN